MHRPTDIQVLASELYFLPVRTRVPLKFGAETLTEVVCARVKLDVADRSGRRASGWGETPLSVQWGWPGALPFSERSGCFLEFCRVLARAWAGFSSRGHPLEVGYDFLEHQLPAFLGQFRRDRPAAAQMPWLAALICNSAFDLALHDAFGQSLGRPVYESYTSEFMSRDLGDFLEPADPGLSFHSQFPAEYLVQDPPGALPAWHLVGGLDLLDDAERTGQEPDDGYPVVLSDWIRRDGLTCLKVKLRGTDAEWDFHRLLAVGDIARRHGTKWLSADFNCTVRDPEYVNGILDRLRVSAPRVWDMILYVEQPFPYELGQDRIPAHSVSRRKPLFLDESAHDWRHVRLGRELGWTGVALKTCKTQTGAILSACWARAHNMALMVQDLTNPMLAQIPHVLLAQRVGTIMGVETNAMQFYPEASRAEAAVHPGLYRRREGQVRLDTIRGPGFGYRLGEIRRELPAPAAAHAA